MKIKEIICATMLMLIAVLSAPTYASSISFGNADVLYTNPNLNKKLTTGEYDFAGSHSRFGSSFKDRWKFTVAENSTASISVYDLETSFGKSNSGLPQTSFRQSRQFGRARIDTSKIFDTKNMTFSLFDSKGKLLGSAGENGTLSGLNLVAGKWYTLQVSGIVGGFFGSSYHGVLDINPTVTAVPLGDTAPLFGSALALLALRYRKRFSLGA
ncbi:MAG TPA: hypothetical protein VGK97_02225 [Spongiibacteraceae bacterium]|jgi:hypothetical protein